MSDRLWVGSRKGLFEIRNNRITKQHFPGQPVTALLAEANDIYCALNLGHFGPKLWRSANGGGSWDECACPAYPKEGESGATLNQIWVMERREGTLWAGTLPGGLFKSSDGAKSWTLIDSLWNRPERKEWVGGGSDAPGIHSILFGRDESITLGVSVGGIWKSRDRGESWELSAAGMRAIYMPPAQQENQNAQDPHRVVHCAAEPEVMWAQHHCGIYRSTDGGESWREIEKPKPSAFGFAVAAHPRDPNIAWFVPADADERRYPRDGKLVVTRTRDGGKTFDVLSEGLPQEHAYDLVYRHALDVDASAERLAMGSTTGGLWTSRNGGDSWHCISAHLPPIYCLRFET